MVNAVILYNIYSSTQVIGGIQDPIRWPSITHCNVALAIFFNLPSVEATTENSKLSFIPSRAYNCIQTKSLKTVN